MIAMTARCPVPAPAARQKRSRTRLFRFVLLAIGFVLAACGGSSETADPAGGVEPQPTQRSATATAAAEPQEAAQDTEQETAQEPTASSDAAATASPEPSATARASTASPSATVPADSPTAESAPLPERTTIDELLAREGPLSLAHAGGDQEAPHSTMFAFDQAVRAGVDMLEIDVQLTGDGELIVHHDATVDGTTDSTGLVLDLTLAEIQALDNAYWYASECWPCRDLADDAYLFRGVRTGAQPAPAGYSAEDFRVLTMRELVEQFPHMPFDIEIKGDLPGAFAVVDALAAEIKALDLTDNVVVVSFNDEVIAAFEAAAPEVETSPGTNELGFWVLAEVPITGNRIVQVPPFFDGLEVINEEFMARAAEAGLEVWVWPNDARTQENTDFYRELIDLGVDGIIAGRPDAMEAARS